MFRQISLATLCIATLLHFPSRSPAGEDQKRADQEPRVEAREACPAVSKEAVVHGPYTFQQVLHVPKMEEGQRSAYEKLEQKLAVLFPNSKVNLVLASDLLASDKIVVQGQAPDSDEAERIRQIVFGEVIHQKGDAKAAQMEAETIREHLAELRAQAKKLAETGLPEEREALARKMKELGEVLAKNEQARSQAILAEREAAARKQALAAQEAVERKKLGLGQPPEAGPRKPISPLGPKEAAPRKEAGANAQQQAESLRQRLEDLHAQLKKVAESGRAEEAQQIAEQIQQLQKAAAQQNSKAAEERKHWEEGMIKKGFLAPQPAGKVPGHEPRVVEERKSQVVIRRGDMFHVVRPEQVEIGRQIDTLRDSARRLDEVGLHDQARALRENAEMIQAEAARHAAHAPHGPGQPPEAMLHEMQGALEGLRQQVEQLRKQVEQLRETKERK